MASVYSGAGEGRYGTVVVKGQVEFAMQYNYKLSALEVHVVRCKDLAAVDAKRNRSDPYVKVSYITNSPLEIFYYNLALILFRCIYCPTNRRLASAKPKSRSTR